MSGERAAVDPWTHAIDCDTCHGPAFGRSDLAIDLAHIAYWVWMRMPGWLAFNRVGFAILPYAGTVAYSCTCRDKNRRVEHLRSHGGGESPKEGSAP